MKDKKDKVQDAKADAGNSAVVSIVGDQVKVFSELGADYIQRMANFINHIVDEFNHKKGYGVSRSMLLTYAALELCDTLLRERDRGMTKDERKYEQMFHMEVFSHKRTGDQLDAAEKRLAESERQLAQARKDIEDLIEEYGKNEPIRDSQATVQ